MKVRDTVRRVVARARAAAQSYGHTLLGLPFVRRFRGLQLRRMRPLADGRQRGQAIVRYYWDRFLETHRADIRGRCLEVGSQLSIHRFGGPAVTASDAIDVTRHGHDITMAADLSRADGLASDSYDCFIVPFTMHLIYDVEAALYHSVRVLKPGGVLLVNFPSVDYYFPRGLDMGTGQTLFMFWWFTPIQVDNLLRRAGLTAGDYHVRVDGNLFARVAYQMNMPAEELSREELEHEDEGHPLIISVRAVKPADWRAKRPEYKDPWLPHATPDPWNPVTGHYPEP